MRLHDEIMNLRCDTSGMDVTHALSCKLGHRAARHAAAELAIEVENQRDELLETLKAARLTLERENAWPDGGGPIVDTIWHTNHETLFDFMDAAIEKATNTTNERK